jgi:imidazolonepropionase-like amidohydrolase
VSDEALTDVVERTVEAGSWVVPTMALWEVLWGVAQLAEVRAYPELQYMPRDMVDQWVGRHQNRLADPELDLEVSRRVIDNRMRLLGAMNDGGVRILMGTDAPQQFSVPGFSLHRELERMAVAGMTPYEILRSGTVNVGEYFSEQDAFGTVSPGQRADLILVTGNPLEDVDVVASPAGVMVRGRWLPRDEIDRRLDEIAAGYEEGPDS